MAEISEQLRQKLFDLMRFYSGAEYALAELKDNPSFNASQNGKFVQANATKVIDLIGEILDAIGYQIKAYSSSHDGSPVFYQNEPKDMGGILRDGAGFIGFVHQDEQLTMIVGEQARFVSDRFLPDSWGPFVEEIHGLCIDQEVASLRK